MTRKVFCNKMLELMRRVYYQNDGTCKGFGKIAKHYRRSFRLDFKTWNQPYHSYSEVWNSDLLKRLRKIVYM